MAVSLKPSDSSQQLQERFAALIEPYRPALEWYCRSIAGSSWEADDLVQDTWLKAFAMFKREPYRCDMSKAYLFRIASNSWIDRYRKARLTVHTVPDELHLPAETAADSLEVKDAMETLVAELPPRQQIILLLIDVFQFTASEAANMTGSTEGAVKASLHRARTKLKSLHDPALKRRKVDEKLVYAYLEAFQRQNPYALLLLHNDAAQLDLVPKVQGSRKAGPEAGSDEQHGAMAYGRIPARRNWLVTAAAAA